MTKIYRGGRLTVMERVGPNERREVRVTKLDPNQLWHDPLEVGEDVRVRDLLAILEQAPDFWYTVFPGPNVKAMVQEGLTNRQRRLPRRTDRQALTFSWFSETIARDGLPVPVQPPWLMDLDITGLDGRRHAGIDFLSPSDIAPLKVRIETEFTYDREFRQIGTRFHQPHTAYTLDMSPSLGHVLNSLLCELGWWGPPDEVKVKRAELSQRKGFGGDGEEEIYLEADEVFAAALNEESAEEGDLREKLVANQRAKAAEARGVAMTPEDIARKLEVAQWMLLTTMQNACRECDGTTWRTNLEFELWQDVLEGGEWVAGRPYMEWWSRAYDLRKFALQVNAWFVHDAELGPRFVPLEEWERVYAEMWLPHHPTRTFEERWQEAVDHERRQLAAAREVARKMPRGRVIGAQ